MKNTQNTTGWLPVRATALRKTGDTFTMRPGDPAITITAMAFHGMTAQTSDGGGIGLTTDWAVYVPPTSPIRRRKGARF